MRLFILEINRLHKTTVLLTTHDLGDVEEFCRRLIVINHGRIVEDGALDDLINRLTPYRDLIVECPDVEGIRTFTYPYTEIYQQRDDLTWIRFERAQVSASQLINELSRQFAIRDVRVKEPDIEEVIRKIYGSS